MIVIYAHLRIIRETDPVHDENIYIFIFTQKAGSKDLAVVDISWAIGKFIYILFVL